MRDKNAHQLLATVMNWRDNEAVLDHVPALQLLAEYKYDQYQRFGPGKRFMESLALWLAQFDSADRDAALGFVKDNLVCLSESELSHLVRSAYPDMIVQERLRMVAEEHDIPLHRVARLAAHRRFHELRLKSLYLGLSDGARTNEIRRASDGDIGNEQIWQAYELGPDKSDEMREQLSDALRNQSFPAAQATFNLVWLLDDFSGSGNTYIRFDAASGKYKGKIKKIYDQLHKFSLVDRSHYEVFLLLYVATRQAIDHIEYWAERFTTDGGYKPLHVRILYPLEPDVAIDRHGSLRQILASNEYRDSKVVDKHFLVGGTDDERLGFAACSLPVVLPHNTPNNSLFVLWGPETSAFPGLFPRVSRHREF